MSKYRVHVECTKSLPETNSQYDQCLNYVEGAPPERNARAKAVEMAKQHYVEYDSFTPYHTEKLK